MCNHIWKKPRGWDLCRSVLPTVSDVGDNVRCVHYVRIAILQKARTRSDRTNLGVNMGPDYGWMCGALVLQLSQPQDGIGVPTSRAWQDTI